MQEAGIYCLVQYPNLVIDRPKWTRGPFLEAPGNHLRDRAEGGAGGGGGGGALSSDFFARKKK